jgi:NTE family protein
VSGGSIMNGYLASRVNGLQGGVLDFDSVSKGVRDFCSLDIRRWLALEAVIPGTHNSSGLADQYNKHLTGGRLLKDLPDAPKHIFCSTDLGFGVNWMFKKKQCGDYQAGFMDTPADWKIATAVAASSCFPPVFKPLALNLNPTKLLGGRYPAGAYRDKLIREITFSDGGVYDNLGLEPIWKDHEYVLASDGGALFSIGGDTGFGWEVGRFIGIPESQALALRKRWLIAGFVSGQMKGTYWGIGGTCAEYGVQQGYSEDLAKNYIAAIRTDLDSFSDAEASVLENHGYWLADETIQAHVKTMATKPVPLNLPHPEWAGPEDKIKQALKDSPKRTLLGHGHHG